MLAFYLVEPAVENGYKGIKCISPHEYGVHRRLQRRLKLLISRMLTLTLKPSRVAKEELRLGRCLKSTVRQIKSSHENFITAFIFRGVGRDRTADTRIFSPLLYRLSYRTISCKFYRIFSLSGCKYKRYFILRPKNILVNRAIFSIAKTRNSLVFLQKVLHP
jgi:hypothetical protein